MVLKDYDYCNFAINILDAGLFNSEVTKEVLPFELSEDKKKKLYSDEDLIKLYNHILTLKDYRQSYSYFEDFIKPESESQKSFLKAFKSKYQKAPNVCAMLFIFKICFDTLYFQKVELVVKSDEKKHLSLELQTNPHFK